MQNGKKYKEARRRADRKSTEVESLGERINRYLDIPPDIVPGGSTVELRCRSSLTVRGCGKILLYSPCEIRLEMKDGILCVRGSRLLCTSYYVGAVGIDGRIDSISFDDGTEV
ncbi:MAG: YabP/YqfC family sporulation protein [Eubacteriales bacterium]